MLRFRHRLEQESERTQRMPYAELLQLCRDRWGSMHACMHACLPDVNCCTANTLA